MKSQLLKEELSEQCKKLSNQLANMNVGNSGIPRIELDIFLKNIQEFYEKAVEFKHVEMSQPQEEKDEIPQEEKNDVLIEAVVKEEPVLLDTKIPEEVVSKEPEAVVPDVIHEAAVVESTTEPEKEALETVPQSEEKEIVFEEKEEITTEAPKDPSFNDLLEESINREDLFTKLSTKRESLDLNKKLAEARGNHSLAEKLQKQQIESLKAVIGVNDKFYFINELFGGDTSKYEDVIYTLNNFKKFDDAMQYFSTLKYRFNWKEDSKAPEMLVKMLERKFDLVKA